MDDEIQGRPLHLPKMLRANAFKLKARICSKIQNYEELPHLITSIHTSHARVFKSMDVVVRTHAIPSIGTLTQAKINAHVWLELKSYFDDLMCITTSPDLPISADIMHKYVVGPTTLKTMMHILSDELTRGPWAVFPDAMEARVRFQTDATAEHTGTINDYWSWHQYVTVDQHENVEELDFHGCLSQSDV